MKLTASVTLTRQIQGPQGPEGPQGQRGPACKPANIRAWDTIPNGAVLTPGNRDADTWTDIVYVIADNEPVFYLCVAECTKVANTQPSHLTYSGKLISAAQFQSLATRVILAQNAVISLLQGNKILLNGTNGNACGMQGGDADNPVRIWAGNTNPSAAPFQVLQDGSIIGTKGYIAGFEIVGNTLTNSNKNNDAGIIFYNSTHNVFAAIGGNVLPASSGNRALARFENLDTLNQWGIGRNIAAILSAKNNTYNHAFVGHGNGNLDGWISGYHYSQFKITSSNTIYNGYLKLSENNRWLVFSKTATGSSVMLPSITEVRLALGIADSQKFCFRFLVVGDVNTKNFDVRGRCAWENSDKAKPYDSETYPRIVNWNNETYDTINLGPGDALEMLLVYDPANSEKIGTYPMRYTARLINHQWE